MKKRIVSLLTSLIMSLSISPVLAEETAEIVNPSIFDGIKAATANEVVNAYIQGSAIGGTNSSSYAVFENVDFGTTGLATLLLNIGTQTEYAGGKVRFHIDDKDSAPFAEVTVQGTGSFGVYKWQEATLLDANISGINTVYVTFSANGTGNMTEFKATPKQSSSSDISVPQSVINAGIKDEYLVLTALDILSYDETAPFDPSAQVIASDFAKAALMMTGEKGEHAIVNLVSVCDLAETEAMNAEKACEMIIKLLNRQMLVLEGTSFYEYARELDIKCDTAADYPLDWTNAVKLLYAATEVAPVEIKSVHQEDGSLKATYTARENNTLLLEHRNIRKAKGVLTMDRVTGIKGVNDIGENQVLIDDYIFDLGDCNVDGLLGYEIEYYFESGDYEDTLIFAKKTDRNYTINIEAVDIEDCKNGTLEYYDGTKMKTVRLPSDVCVINNGLADSTYEDADFVITDGNIELISNNRDEIIDVVKIWNTKDYLYAGIVNDTIYFKDSDFTIPYKNNNIKFNLMSKEGLTMSMSRLSENQVFTVSEATTMDENLVVYNIWVNTKPVSGIVKSISREDRQIRIDDKDYILSGDFAKNRSQGISVGMEKKFYLNKYGQITFAESNVVSNKIGYIVKAYTDEENEDTVYVRIFGEDGVMTTYKCYEKITVGGHKKTSGTAILTAVDQNALCVFSTNARGEISKLNFAKNNNEEIENGKNADDANGVYFYLDTGSSGLVYRPESRSMGGQIIIQKGFLTFMVPEDKSMYDKYYIRTSDFSYTYIKNLECYNTKFDAFDANYGVIEFATTTSSIAVNNESEICYINDITEEWNGSEVEMIIGYYGNNGKYTTVRAETGVPVVRATDNTATTDSATDIIETVVDKSDLKPGDAVRFATENGEITKIVKFFGVDWQGDVLNRTLSFDATSKLSYGNVSKKRDKTIQLDGQTEVLNVDGARIYVFENDSITEGSILDIASAEHASSGSKVFVYQKAATVKSLLIVR